jgi:hypothetical protein
LNFNVCAAKTGCWQMVDNVNEPKNSRLFDDSRCRIECREIGSGCRIVPLFRQSGAFGRAV